MPYTPASHYAPQGSRYGSPYDRPAKKKRHTGLIVALAVLAVLVVALVAGGLSLKSTVSRITDQARSLSPLASQIETDARNLDGAALVNDATSLQEGIAAIESDLDHPLINLASIIPAVGDTIGSAKTVLTVADGLASDVLAPVGQTLASYPLSSLMSGSGIDGTVLQQYCALVTQITPAVTRASQQLDTVGTSRISQINDVVAKLKDPLAQTSELLESYGSVIAQLPELLGCNGARTYLVIAQNNAEIRSTGGFPGAWGTVTIENGQVSMGDFATIAGQREATFELTDEELAVFGEGMAVNPANLNMTPDFPRAAQLLAQAWAYYTGQSVDGVLALDPVFLQDVLALSGGVTASDGTVVDGSNAASELLNGVYMRYGNDGTGQDAFFAEVAGLAAEQIMGNISSIDLLQLAEVIQDDAAQGRLIVWSSNADVEAALTELGLDGALSSDAANPVLGVYLNDNTWGKLAWYLNASTQVTGSSINADGSVTYDVSTTLTNTVTADEVAIAPTYITGLSPAKRSDDDLYLSPVLLVAPAGGSVSGVVCSSGAAFTETSLYGHDTWVGSINLAAQESVVVSYQVTVAAGAAELQVHQTPTGQRTDTAE